MVLQYGTRWRPEYWPYLTPETAAWTYSTAPGGDIPGGAGGSRVLDAPVLVAGVTGVT